MQNRESWLKMACVLLLMFNNRLCNFNFVQPASFISEGIKTHLKISVSPLTALMLKFGRILRLGDDPWHENFTPCQHLNSNPVVENLKQRVLCWKKKVRIFTYLEVSSPQMTSAFCPLHWLSYYKNLEGTHFFHGCIQNWILSSSKGDCSWLASLGALKERMVTFPKEIILVHDGSSYFRATDGLCI